MQTKFRRNDVTRVTLPLALLLCLLFGIPVLAATQAEGDGAGEGTIRYSFAETYVGADASLWGGEMLPALSIGGTHFWGASDIYVRFPIGSVAAGAAQFSPGIETAFHWYPTPLTKDSIRPYIGAGWTVAFYETDDGPDVTKHMFPLKAGVSMRKEDHLFELGLSYLASSDLKYPVDSSANPLNPVTDVPRLGVSLGYKYLFDTTLHAAPRYEQEQEEAVRLGRAGRLDSWGVILSPSTLFPVGNGSLQPHLVGYPPALTYEIGLSRYFYDYDLSVQAIYRPGSMSQTAFGDEAKLGGQSLRLEGLKFIPFDYHGFVPFVGAGYGYEDWDENRSWAIAKQTKGWAPSFAFGWEIRPTRKESFYLRQSMRYTAARAAGAPVDAFDVSFIQFIYYFGR